ncbi:J domain-containing protein [Roseomonas sp. NAR14]|uniref:J domain-containing protein n=1 Tax=Roseomonas acroporae TaxID=2937791 RepID=A0A9X1YCL2_9PROT|nr:J domain-containing protein [Roseomonas acroporae]MCK8786545.1 J domain-containing protein [Roseomonas acroporae]
MAEKDPYQTLGLKRDASEAEIRSAYRKLARKHHPDLNPGDKQAEERFKEVSAANDLLSDPEKRARFDRGEIDASGQERPERNFYRGFAEGREGARYRPGDRPQGGFATDFGEDDFGDVFADLFGRTAQGRSGPNVRMRGRDQHYRMTVDLLDAIRGATRALTLPDGRSLDVRIPVGIEDGQVMRLKGQGSPGLNGGPAGDALIEIQIAPHPFFRREGDDIHVEVPVTVAEAVLGGKITVPTPTGNVSVTVPKRSDTGAQLRLRGKGVPAHAGRPAGDQYVTLKVVLGEVDQDLERFLRDWAPCHAANPRRAMTGEA